MRILVLLIAALFISEARAQGLCPQQYESCVTTCASRGTVEVQNRCIGGCQEKNNACAASVWNKKSEYLQNAEGKPIPTRTIEPVDAKKPQRTAPAPATVQARQPVEAGRAGRGAGRRRCASGEPAVDIRGRGQGLLLKRRHSPRRIWHAGVICPSVAPALNIGGLMSSICTRGGLAAFILFGFCVRDRPQSGRKLSPPKITEPSKNKVRARLNLEPRAATNTDAECPMTFNGRPALPCLNACAGKRKAFRQYHV